MAPQGRSKPAARKPTGHPGGLPAVHSPTSLVVVALETQPASHQDELPMRQEGWLPGLLVAHGSLALFPVMLPSALLLEAGNQSKWTASLASICKQ